MEVKGRGRKVREREGSRKLIMRSAIVEFYAEGKLDTGKVKRQVKVLRKRKGDNNKSNTKGPRAPTETETAGSHREYDGE